MRQVESQLSILAATPPANKLAPTKQAPLPNSLYAGRWDGRSKAASNGMQSLCNPSVGKALPIHPKHLLGCFFMSCWQLQQRNQGANGLWRTSPLASQPDLRPGGGRSLCCNFPGDNRGIHCPRLSVLHLLTSIELTLIRKGVKRFLISLITWTLTENKTPKWKIQTLKLQAQCAKIQSG